MSIPPASIRFAAVPKADIRPGVPLVSEYAYWRRSAIFTPSEPISEETRYASWEAYRDPANPADNHPLPLKPPGEHHRVAGTWSDDSTDKEAIFSFPTAPSRDPDEQVGVARGFHVASWKDHAAVWVGDKLDRLEQMPAVQFVLSFLFPHH